MDVQALREMADVDICSVSKESLIDIQNIKIDAEKEPKERILDFLCQIKNPYCFICNDMIVKMRFSSNGNALEDKLNSYFHSL